MLGSHRGLPRRAGPADTLSPAALQMLAIVAYERPVTRADISRIRSVDGDGIVDSLVVRGGWPRIVGSHHGLEPCRWSPRTGSCVASG